MGGAIARSMVNENCSLSYMCVLRKSLITVRLVLVDVIDGDMLLLSFKKQSIAISWLFTNMISEILVLEIAAVHHVSVYNG